MSSPEAPRRRGRMSARWRSLRLRVPLIVTGVFALSLIVALVVTFQLLRQEKLGDLDDAMAQERERLALTLEDALAETPDGGDGADGAADADAAGGEGSESSAAAEQAARLDRIVEIVRDYFRVNPGHDEYWTVVTLVDGRRLAPTQGPGELDALLAAADQGDPSSRATVTVTDTGEEVRVTRVPIRLDGQEVAALQLLAPIGPLQREITESVWLLAAAAGVTLLVGGLMLFLSLWRSLTPLKALASTARETDLASLDRRVEIPDTGDEVADLAAEFNRMLERLRAASEQERTLLASVSHELRTPITIAQGHLELLEREAGGQRDETVAVVRDELTRLGRLVEDLLAVARQHRDDFVRPQRVDLVGWTEELELRARALADGRLVIVHPPEAVTVRVDPERLGQAVLNLVRNAVLHTPTGTRVDVHTKVDDDGLRVRVIDDGPGIPADLRDEVLEPFVHGGARRGSTGLGLAVVAAVVAAHDGEIDVDSDELGTRIELRVPTEVERTPTIERSPT